MYQVMDTRSAVVTDNGVAYEPDKTVISNAERIKPAGRRLKDSFPVVGAETSFMVSDS